jgi:hypothetical protein
MMEYTSTNQYIFYIDPIHLQVEALGEKTKDGDVVMFDMLHRPRLLAAVISNAVHEVTHLTHRKHDELFATAMNSLFTRVLSDRIFDKILAQDDETRICAKRLFVSRSKQQRAEEKEHKKRKITELELPLTRP